jgi:large subunit ribosomal protein LP2
MRYVAAYLLAVLSGNQSPDSAAIEKILSSVGVKVEKEKATKVINELKGKSLEELIKEGTKKLASVPAAPAAGAAAAAPAAAAGGAAKKEEPSKNIREIYFSKINNKQYPPPPTYILRVFWRVYMEYFVLEILSDMSTLETRVEVT